MMASMSHLMAVETMIGGNPTYNTNNNISSSVSGWTTANSWGTGNTNTGWNYVGQVGGANEASGVYLGNGWVITAGHVGALNFTLGTNTYATTGYSYTNFSISTTNTNTGTIYTYFADLNLFKVSTSSTLGNSLLPTNKLTLVPAYNTAGQTVVMIGYGDAAVGRQKSWGINTVTANNILVPLGGYPYTTVDFKTAYGTNSYGTTNSALVIVGDSGGGDFVSDGGKWYLAGLNEAVDSNSNSYFVNLGYYSSQITDVMNSVPEPSTWALMGLGFCFITFVLRKNRSRI
jgi:hypothetical protein